MSDNQSPANQAHLDELIRHNGNLVRTASALRSQRNQAISVVDAVVAQARGIVAAGEDTPTEFIIPAACLDSMRALAALLKAWDTPA